MNFEHLIELLSVNSQASSSIDHGIDTTKAFVQLKQTFYHKTIMRLMFDAEFLQKSSSEDNSSSREYEDTPESSKEFKPLADGEFGFVYEF